ncbi:hypothetical protein ACTFSK_24485 [Bacillus cereus group sp. MYBK132-2]|uniref:AbiTii domain-containing protein n=1 Tax=unclassified Bacillus cereus group TaxID=2750818 RepID=UPI003F79117C
MRSIVTDLQEEAYSSNPDFTALLRKAYVVARKLKIVEFEKWINNELNGFKNPKDIPDYRRVRGKLYYFHPYHGWYPLGIENAELENKITTQEINQPISQLQLLSSGEGSPSLEFQGEIRNMLSDLIDMQTHFSLHLDRSELIRILNTCRNIILDWSLKLEEDGIMGEGMTFSEKEKQTATKEGYTINNFYGSNSNYQIQQDNQSAMQTMNNQSNGLNINEITTLLSQIQNHIGQAGLNDTSRIEVQEQLNQIEQQLEANTPDKGIVKNLFKSVKEKLIESGSGFVATGITTAITDVLSNM